MLKPRKGTLGILACLLGLVVMGGAGVIWLQHNQLSGMTTELARKQEERNEGERIARRLQQTEQELELDRARLEFLEAGVPNAAYVPTLLRDLESLAVNTHNRVSAVRPELVPIKAPTRLERRRDPNAADKPEGEGDDKEPKEEIKPYDPLNIRVSLVGTYPQIQAFLHQLTRFPKIVAVQELQLRPHAEPGGKGAPANLLDCELKLTAFIMKDSGAVSVDAVTVPATPKPAAKEAL